jgi:hypothetical protein
VPRERVRLEDGRLLVFGWDRPFKTFYAQLYDDPNEHKAPAVVIGYHPVEQQILRAERPEAVIGPYPVSSRDDLHELIKTLMGLEMPYA